MVSAHRVVPDPRPVLADIVKLLERPEDLEELFALSALTDPVVAEALSNISTIPLADRYSGPRTAIVMAPFLQPGASRFSPGTFGVFYSADALIVAVRESAYHAARLFLGTHAAAPATIPRYGLTVTLDEQRHADIRRGGPHDVRDEHVYDPSDYSAAQQLGIAMRRAGHDGVWYDSVRSSGGTCWGTFRPAAVRSVGDEIIEMELLWNGQAINEYRVIASHSLD